ncbi:MAG: threonylcarbamoyl-AMP synthase [Desulfarculales bacterium]|jgi:tRNA threonylcarbamoyl adenosine modification protein (Sua5/YciO/YrdC/YwlC family)|nr:threonylcarbamoyl-AMP synthase [Desulfarculales bacterium]
MLLEVHAHNPQPRRISQAVEILKEGGIIAFPTDTVYGLGCDIFNKQAILRIHQLKRRPAGKPFSFICPDLKELSRYANVTNYAYKTLKRLLPGPYTFILEGSRQVPKLMLTRQKTAGIRVPANQLCQSLARALGNPLLSSSITNPTEADYVLNAWEIEDLWGKRIDLVLDGGPVPGEPSSVVSLVGDQPEVLRAGAGAVEEFLSS